MASRNPLPETRVLKEGFLTKKGSALVKQWKERWFVVKGQNLYYYRNPRDKKPVGSLSLKDVQEIMADNKEHMPNCFRLVTKKKVHLMSAQTPDDRDNWIKVLEISRTGFEPAATPTISAQTTPTISAQTTPTQQQPLTDRTDQSITKLQLHDVRNRSASTTERPVTPPSKHRTKQVAEAPDVTSASNAQQSTPSAGTNLAPPQGLAAQGTGPMSQSGPIPTSVASTTKVRNQSRPKAATAPRQRFISEPKQLVTAKYDYTAGTERELSFKAGDKIMVLKKYESGWWLGELDGKIGHFPASYADTTGDDAEENSEKSEEGANKKVARVKALYDYKGQSYGELSFKKDDEFVLLEKLSDGGWWRGQIDDKKGHFPASYVQIIEDYSNTSPSVAVKTDKIGNEVITGSPPALPAHPHRPSSASSSDQDSDREDGRVMSLGRARGNAHKPKLASPPSPADESKPVPGTKREAQVIGQYQLGEMLGKGAFGTVYRGLNIETGAFVAIKQITTRGLPKGQLGSIMSELQLLKELKHPNIVQYIALIETREHVNFVLEYIEGGSLEALLKKFGRMPETLIVRYTQQILSGLQYLHSRNVIHRDIKCGNILITKDGTVKLADFGIATKLSSDAGPDAAGSPYWMAPEIIELRGACTASDIWSLGCTMIELITGDPPFSEMGPMAALFAMVEQPYPPIPTTSPIMRSFLMKCFIRDVTERWSATRLLDHCLINPNVPPDFDTAQGTEHSAEEEESGSMTEEEDDDSESEMDESIFLLKKIEETTNWLRQVMKSKKKMEGEKLSALCNQLREQVGSFRSRFGSLPAAEIALRSATEAIADAESSLAPSFQFSLEGVSLDKLG
eukprot:TRINITY_DN12221_c0_g1_i1.p1 TRINITY_DN12221_c0_g1~~TRINITY_DN12221_c0_g1_i1.p1  ORF type:complete len:853 (-),score=167.69 TRINITY_DN12221_c0_g1_i1:79-2637(-)